MEKDTMPELIGKKMISSIKPTWKYAFLGGMIIGLLTYLYYITNNFMTYDSLWNIYSSQDMITSGRQFLTYACGISSFYNLPYLNGVLAIFYLSITAVIVVEGLRIQSKAGAVLVAGLLVTFPAVSSTFCYIYTVDGYMLAVLLAALAFLVTDKKKWGFFAGIVFLGISMGIYQAYLSFTILLCILKLLVDILENKKIKELWSAAWRYMVMGIGSYVFYVVTLKIMLKIKNVEISGYQGTDRIGNFSLADFPRGLKTAWDNFINFARWENVLTTTAVMKYAFILIMLCAVLMYGYLFFEKKCYKNVLNIILVVMLCAVIPFGSTIINILSPDTFFHLLMRLPWALFFVFAVLLGEKIVLKKEKTVLDVIKGGVVSVTYVCAAILIFQFAVMANIVAFNMNARYEKTYATCLRLADRIEQTEGYTTGTKVAILGGVLNAENYPNTEITTEDLVGYFGSNGELCANDTGKFAEFMKHYLNVTIHTIPTEEEIELTKTEKFQSMPCFPAEGSVDFIGDVLVIKLNG